MDIGKKNDYTFYKGYEGEPQIIICIENRCNMHIWEGYFDDIFENPSLDGNGWIGFTRDYHQFEGVFSEDVLEDFIEPKEYLQDLCFYKGKKFEFEETSELLEKLIELFEMAILNNLKVKVEIN